MQITSVVGGDSVRASQSPWHSVSVLMDAWSLPFGQDRESIPERGSACTRHGDVKGHGMCHNYEKLHVA